MIKRILTLTALVYAMSFYAQTDSTANNALKDTTNTSLNLPIFSTSGGDLDTDLEQQDVSSLLMSSRDVFTQFASFQFGAARYRMRGYMAENQMVMINGINVNNLETGFSSWSNWGGLNDVTNHIENRFGNVANRMNFSGPGGYTNIDSRASSFKKGTRVSYSSSNRIFQQRGMITHSTGMMQNGWAITISASTRQGDAQRKFGFGKTYGTAGLEGDKKSSWLNMYSPGTYFNAYAFYLAVDKRINDKHLLSFTGFGAPIEQARSSAETQEAYDIAGSNYYNSLWGYQDGKVRNSTVSNVNRPMLMLSHIYTPSSDSKLTTTAYFNFGKSSLTALNWNNAPNPRPDYYKYFPSYYYMSGDTVNGNNATNNWANDVNTRQINWDKMIAMNQANLYSDPGNINSTDTRARYIVEKRVEQLQNYGFNTVYNKRMNKLFLSLGVNGNIYKNRKYKVMDDLLGATFWIDVDQFAENLGVDNAFAQNDISNPNRKIYKGDKFGYDYSLNINRGEVWGQAEYALKSMDVYVGLTLSDNVVWREGYVANGKFPTDSKGKSDKANFFNYGLKGGLTYKLSGRHFITANGSFLTRTPEVGNIFIAPRVRNDMVQGIRSEQVLSGDINYIIRYPGLKVRATYYYTQINNQTWVRTFWSDLYNNNVDLIMRGVNQTHQGVELGVEKTVFTSHVLQGALGYGQFYYTNRPKLDAYQDNNNTSLYTDRTVYLKNYKVGGSPQMVMGLSYKYNGKKFWYAGISLNYFDQIYIEPNPDRRTAESIAKYTTSDLGAEKLITNQERLPSYYTMNLQAGKSFKISKKYFLRLNLTVNNVLNNQKIRTSGYEQLRWDMANISTFDNKYYYMQGVTYMAGVNFSF
jgi:hypothetical protein